jgi:hypothetical protein
MFFLFVLIKCIYISSINLNFFPLYCLVISHSVDVHNVKLVFYDTEKKHVQDFTFAVSVSCMFNLAVCIIYDESKIFEIPFIILNHCIHQEKTLKHTYIYIYTVKPVLRGHFWDEENVDL